MSESARGIVVVKSCIEKVVKGESRVPEARAAAFGKSPRQEMRHFGRSYNRRAGGPILDSTPRPAVIIICRLCQTSYSIIAECRRRR